MISDRFIDHIAETVRFEAGKNNPVLETDPILSGYVIRLCPSNERHLEAIYYAGKGKEPTEVLNDAEFYDTPKQAWDAIITEKVRPLSDKELPKIVYCGIVSFTTEREI